MPYPSGVNRPDLHLSTTFTLRTNGGLEAVEDQPDELNLTNPRNLKAARFRVYHHGFFPLSGFPDRLRTRYLTWQMDTKEITAEYNGADLPWSNEPGYAPEPDIDSLVISGSGSIDSWTGSLTGFQPGTFDATGVSGDYQIDVVTNGVTDSNHGFVVYRLTANMVAGSPWIPENGYDRSYKEYTVTYSLSDAWDALDIQDRAQNGVENLPDVFDALDDGKVQDYTMTEGPVFEAQAATLSDIDESYKYEASVMITNRDNVTADEWEVLVYWCIPLGGFSIWTMPTSGESELQAGEPDIPAQASSMPRNHYRGSYDGNDAPDSVLIASGDGYILTPSEFQILTNFNESNYSSDTILRCWRQIRYFEDWPWVWTARWRIEINGCDISGLWLPTNAGSYTSWYSMALRPVNGAQDGSEDISMAVLIADGQLDKYSNTVSTYVVGVVPDGMYHLVITNDLGEFNSKADGNTQNGGGGWPAGLIRVVNP